MSESQSCVGCKFLYGDGRGYSNYTWMETHVRCALHLNPALSGNIEGPYDWAPDGDTRPGDVNKAFPDTWVPTMNGRCERYSPGPYITLDPDRENSVESQGGDAEQIAAIGAADVG